MNCGDQSKITAAAAHKKGGAWGRGREGEGGGRAQGPGGSPHSPQSSSSSAVEARGVRPRGTHSRGGGGARLMKVGHNTLEPTASVGAGYLNGVGGRGWGPLGPVHGCCLGAR